MNRFSSNFIADSLQIFMGKILKDDTTKGVEILNDFVFDNMGKKLNIINGSGLGNGKNFIEPIFFINLLSIIKSNFLNSVDFFFSLPVAGEDGTLKKVKQTTYQGKIRAKTGTLTGVVALSGIMQGKSGKLYLFTFVVNNFYSKNFKTMWHYRDKIMQYFWEKL
jgi:D-alanyl-D-alanine carboxypeptidase/D-alanyl-D-alanine-endopeptidase (penicillin-binding protein 4)